MINSVCAVGLVLAMDVSASMSDESWRMQRNGLADAFKDPGISRIILNQPGGVAITVVQFASQAVITQAWVRLTTQEDIERLSRNLRVQHRSLEVGEQTAVGVGMNLGVMLLNAGDNEITINGQPQRAPCQAQRKVIDISGDGRSNHGISPSIVRDFAESREITVNGLPIVTELDAEVAQHYQDGVITSDGFAVVADGFEDFARAIRRKLATEIADAR